MRFRVVSAAALLTAVPGLSLALGLGDETVRSYLNAPLNAEIELFATPDELASLQVQLASRDDFLRHGLDYPGFLTGIQIRTERLADGRNIIRLSSSQPIVEPFVVVLVDVRSAGSRLLREYTLLLDPPTFQTQQAPAAPVTAPSAGQAPGTAVRPAPAPAPAPAPTPPPRATTPPAPAPAPAPAPVQAPPAAAAASQYTVQRGDTLSRIATRQYGEQDATRGMIAIYRANPQAFAGNINVLQAGATLQLPDQQGLAAISRADAVAEVRAQMAAWRSASEAPAENVEARLRLVPPGGTAGTSTSGGSESDAGGAAAPATPDRPLAVESADLARLQGQTPGSEATPPAAEAPVGESTGTDAAEPADVADAGAEPAPAEPAPEQAEPAPPAATEPAAEDRSPGLLDRLIAYWYIPVGLLALIAALLGLVAARRRREAASDFAPLGGTLDELTLPGTRDPSSDTFPLRKPADNRDSNIVVEESNGLERTGNMRRDTQTIDLEEGASSATMSAAAMEQGDPLAEADFHMAYGLYDQAADLVKAALEREPERRDLKLKLLEVFFVWGNKDQFLQTARDLGRSRESAPPGEWEKVVIMGKQLAPEDVLFHQSSSAAAAQTSVDLNLEGGQNLVDFDLPESDGADGIDVNLGATDMVKALDDERGIDFAFDDLPPRGEDGAPTATTRQMVQPGLDSINAPTVEQPALDIDDTLAGKLDAHGFSGSPDQTAELAIDDLGLDLGKLEATGTGMSPPDGDEAPPDAPTLVAGLDETSRELLASADASQRTEMLPLTDLDLGGTDTGLDIDFSTADTGKAPALDAGSDLDLDVGSADKPEGDADAADWQSTQRIDPSMLDDTQIDGDIQKQLEPVTMSEVGTKLDLARAYMDMGDPDGARSILNEVLQEGSESQRTEARRLLDSIPG